jgi:hypothetical protein
MIRAAERATSASEIFGCVVGAVVGRVVGPVVGLSSSAGFSSSSSYPGTVSAGGGGMDCQVSIFGLMIVANLLLPVAMAVVKPALCASSNSVGWAG